MKNWRGPKWAPSQSDHGAMPRNVYVLGLVSMLNDIASEMIYPIVPIFLTGVLGVPMAIFGLIEGVAEATASLLKLFSGWLSDRLQQRKPFVVLGYACSAISKLIFGFAWSWHTVFVARFVDRFGKGVRTSARDALISESVPAAARGRAFGFHRALDTIGAIVGPVIALGLLNIFKADVRPIFFLAAIPAFIGLVVLMLFIREKREAVVVKPSLKFRLADFTKPFIVFMVISLIFALGSSSNAFLILRCQQLGLSMPAIIAVYILYNITYALFSMPAGELSDRIGPRRVLLTGFLVFALVYLAFGFIANSFYLWLLFPVFGCYKALTDGVSTAYISHLAPKEKLGTCFGFYHVLVGGGAFISSLIAGLLWSIIGVTAPFIFGGSMALLAAALFAVSWGYKFSSS